MKNRRKLTRHTLVRNNDLRCRSCPLTPSRVAMRRVGRPRGLALARRRRGAPARAVHFAPARVFGARGRVRGPLAVLPVVLVPSLLRAGPPRRVRAGPPPRPPRRSRRGAHPRRVRRPRVRPLRVEPARERRPRHPRVRVRVGLAERVVRVVRRRIRARRRRRRVVQEPPRRGVDARGVRLRRGPRRRLRRGPRHARRGRRAPRRLRAEAAVRREAKAPHRRRRRGKPAQTYDVETKVGGGTAGRFGSAVELVGITVYGGREYLVRATASAAAWPAEKARLRRAVESFRILDAC